jgi:mannose-6-phosphate isomerase
MGSEQRPDMLYPLQFQPIFQERIWGGRNLERLYKKSLPPNLRTGESWEISDRDEAQSVVRNGPLAGKTLRWLMENHERDLLGKAKSLHGRFPLLVKILDAEEKLSLQVHPPPHKARALRGEPKTEMWYIADARPDAELYVGLRQGATREEFETRIRNGTVAECFHRIRVRAGDAMFLPSGRVHAIGAGLVIFEIQQNSDTTYRVFDWNRTDAAGKPRQLHVAESLECIDFNDFTPAPVRSNARETDTHIQPLVEDSLFSVELVSFNRMPGDIDYNLASPRIVAVVEGAVRICDAAQPIDLHPGEFCLLPASLGRQKIEAVGPSKILVAQTGSS